MATDTVDLGAIEDVLNKDDKAREAFMKDPAGYLAGQGLKVPAAAKAQLEQTVKQMTARPAAGARTAATSKTEVSVSVSVKF